MQRQSILQRIQIWILFASYIVIPIILTPQTYESFRLPKDTLVYVSANLLIVLFLINIFITKRITVKRNSLYIPILLFLLISTVSLYTSGVSWRCTIRDLYLLFSIIIFYFFIDQLIENENISLKISGKEIILHSNGWISFLIYTIASISLYISAFGIAQHFGLNKIFGFTQENIMFSTFGNYNYVAEFLVMTFPFLLSFLLVMDKIKTNFRINIDNRKIVGDEVKRLKGVDFYLQILSKKLLSVIVISVIASIAAEFFIKDAGLDPILWFIIGPPGLTILTFLIAFLSWGDMFCENQISNIDYQLSTINYWWFLIHLWIKRIFITIVLFSSFTFILFAKTRGAWLGFIVGMLLYISLIIAQYLSRKNKNQIYATGIFKKLFLIIIFIVFLTGIVLSFSNKYLKSANAWNGIVIRIASIRNFKEPGTVARFIMWGATVEMIKDKPIMGVGIGGLKINFLHYLEKFMISHSNLALPAVTFEHINAQEAHNEYLQVTSELGFVGLAFFLLLYFWIGRNMVIRLKETIDSVEFLLVAGVVSGLVGLSVTAIFGFPFHISQTAMFAGIMLALLRIKIIE